MGTVWRMCVLVYCYIMTRKRNCLQKNSGEATKKKKQNNKKKEGGNLSPRNRKACHSKSTVLLQSVAKIYHVMS
jgi:hypothetical protein